MININAVCKVCNSNIPLFNIDPGNKIRIKRKIACCGLEVVIVGVQKTGDILDYLNENDVTVKGLKKTGDILDYLNENDVTVKGLKDKNFKDTESTKKTAKGINHILKKSKKTISLLSITLDLQMMKQG